jgi:hypothetical protein
MLKRWRTLPQAGVGLLGLALLTFTLNADAASHSFAHGSDMMFGGTAADIEASSASPAISPLPAVTEFSSAGSGILSLTASQATCNGVGLTCKTGDTCQCVTLTGNVTDGIGPLFSGPFVLYLNVDTLPVAHQYPNGNNSGQVCFFGTGVLSLTPGSNATINFITSGAACNAIDNASALYSGGFVIGPSTGGFSNAVGSGIIGFGANSSTHIGVFDLKGAGSNIN